MKIAIVTDAWHPQVNGVVRTLTHLTTELRAMGHDVLVISPDLFASIACPGYAEIRLAYRVGSKVAHMLDAFAPDAVHISTEGPLGIKGRRYCLRRKLPFTTAFHTRFPEYLKAQYGVPEALTYAVLRRFHGPSRCIMVPTPSMQAELESHGFKRVRQWTRGVDTELFKPREKAFLDLPRPIFINVGRVSIEKNIEAFLSLDLPGTKVVVGDGPAMQSMQARFKQAVFVGAKKGEDLARHYAAADVFVFPSKTDTFGLVVLEALSSGVPVAAYPVTGPKDIIESDDLGALDDDLRTAALQALKLDGARCREFALTKSWRKCAEQFYQNLHRIA